MSILYTTKAETLVNGHPEVTPKDPKIAARACFIAGLMYAIFFGFCFCQSFLHSKQKREEEQRFSTL